METAILKEKRLKKWNRAWKLRLVQEANPTWRDLFEDLASRRLRMRPSVDATC